LVRTAVISSAFVFSAATSFGCAVSCSFESVLTATQHLVNPVTRDGQTANPEAQIVQVASLFSQLEGENGETIYPAGTVVDRVEISEERMLTIRLTFLASVKKNSLKEFNVYHAEQVLRYHFAEALELNGAIVYARSGEGGDYAGVGEFIHFEEPGGITARDVALDYEIGGPGPQPDIDL